MNSLNKKKAQRIVALSCLALGLVLFAISLINPKIYDNIIENFDTLLLDVEKDITGEVSEPTESGIEIASLHFDDEINTLLKFANEQDYKSYMDFPNTIIPNSIKVYNPKGVYYFNSKSLPNAEGVIIVTEEAKTWKSGVLFARQRSPEWVGPHLNGSMVNSGPNFGYRRMRNDGIFWHWFSEEWIAKNYK